MDIPNKKPGNKALRKGRFSVPQQIYFITFVTKDRDPAFKEFEPACTAARILSDKGLWEDATLLSWVLMPDHFHGLVEIGACKTLASIVKTVKGRSAHEINRSQLRSGSL
ncbi:MAG: transposase [Arenimonas sp.]